MMMRRWIAALFICLLIAVPCASAQTLPSVEVFSPGLLRVGDMLARGEQVKADAEISVTDMLYVRDLSVLGAMLSGTTFTYEGAGSMAQGSDALTVTRGGEELFAFGVARGGGQAELTINGQTYGIDLSAYNAGIAAADGFAGTAILERVPLASVCAWFEGLKAGDMLMAGYAVTKPFAVERTMSDDGERLTRIEIAGEMAREGEAPYAVEGFLRQPGGRSPKDTFEITLTQDEKNFIELSYSALRTSEITRKNKAGEMEVDTTLKAAGRMAGSSFSSRLRVITRNAWTADGENLHEKVTVSATLGHTDNTPGRRMQRLNDLSAKLRCVLTLDTAEAGNEGVDIREETTLSAVFDGNTFLDMAVNGTAQVGGKGNAVQLTNAPAASQEELLAAFEDAAVVLMQRMYPQLGEKTLDKIGAGL